MITHIINICDDIAGSSRTSISRSTFLVTPREVMPTRLNFVECSGFSAKIYKEILLCDAIKFYFCSLLFLLPILDIGFIGGIATLKIKKQVETEIRA
jgi:hypothetical protein